MIGLDYADERYARLYTRDTPEWHVLTWQAKAVYCLLRRKVDRSGVVPLGRGGLRAVSALVGVPGDVGEPAMRELADAGYLDLDGSRVAVVEFIESETATKSDALRQAESRARRAACDVTKRDDGSRNVTESHAVSHAVTQSHTPSQNVTLCLTDPGLTVPDLTKPESLPPGPPSGGSAREFALAATKAKRPKATRGPMPEDYQPPADVVELAATLGVDLARATADCRDHFAGKWQPMADWGSTLRKWVRREPTFARPTTTRASLLIQTSADEWEAVARTAAANGAIVCGG